MRLAGGVGLWDRTPASTCCPAPASARARRAAGPPVPGRVLQRRLPPRRAVPRSDRQRGGDRQCRVVARPGAGQRACGGRHLGVLRHGEASASSPGASATTATCRRRARWTGSTAAASSSSQGADFAHVCLTSAADCPGQYQGRLQPYAIYIPKKPMPRRGYGLTLLLHSLSANYNQYLGTRNQSQFGERGTGSIVITPEARGPDESLRELRRRGRLRRLVGRREAVQARPRTGRSRPATRWAGSGPSSSAAHFPDLFARIQPTVGDEGATDVLASLRNVPGADVEQPRRRARQQPRLPGDGRRARRARIPLRARRVPAVCERRHAARSSRTTCSSPSTTGTRRAAEFLGAARVERNPAHVTYVVNPARDFPDLEARRRPRVLALGPEAARRGRAGPDRRGLARLRRRRS